MTNKRYIALPALLTLLSCSSGEKEEQVEKKNSFDILCEQFAQLATSEDFPELNSEKRANKLEPMLASSLDPTSNAYLAWEAIRNGPPSERYNLYKDAAASSGYEDWNCEAISQIGHEVGSAHN